MEEVRQVGCDPRNSGNNHTRRQRYDKAKKSFNNSNVIVDNNMKSSDDYCDNHCNLEELLKTIDVLGVIACVHVFNPLGFVVVICSCR